MKKNIIVLILLIIFVCIGVMVFAMSVAVNADSTMQEFYNYERINEKAGYCLFNPDSIISDISSGKDNLFTFSDEKFEYVDPNSIEFASEITLQENLQIIELFFKQFWGEELGGWKIISINYDFFDCNKRDIYGVTYTFEKGINIGSSTIIRKLHILPWQGAITWNQYEEVRSTSKDEVKWNDINYNALDAVSLCELECLNNDYKCGDVFMHIKSSTYPMWNIYFRNDIDDTIHCTVNSVTGEVKKVK